MLVTAIIPNHPKSLDNHPHFPIVINLAQKELCHQGRDAMDFDQIPLEMIRVPRSYMNEEVGTVRELRGEKALVVTDRQSMCGQCVAKSYCHMLGGGKEMIAEARNPIGAKPGDTVKIGIPSGTVTKASFVVYMIPAIGLMGGAVAGYFVGKSSGMDYNFTTLVGCLAGLGISLALVRLLSNTLGGRPSYRPEIIKIINPEDTSCEE
ncbi:MAG: SoxR reducing system RseC family protein [Deltaproteobacteria bacterium]|nr:SoxR reducing system RseC family protein [Deltaproteobacteria bacterium]MBW2309995.1 SoxR reducing system RseC family protein [Deltaproteobacteria bacterium]